MELLNYHNLKLANYLISLFYRTNQKYSCTRYKLNRLLIIASLVTVCREKILIDDALLCNEDASVYSFSRLLKYNLEIYSNKEPQSKCSEILEDEILPYLHIMNTSLISFWIAPDFLNKVIKTDNKIINYVINYNPEIVNKIEPVRKLKK